MSSPDQWKAVDQYVSDMLLPPDSVLEAALCDSAAAGLPAINVSPPQGKFLHLLARSCGAKRILEIGTLGGYSTIWLARALPPGGKLVTLEYQEKHANVARGNFARANLSDVIDLRVGRAIDALPKLAGEQDTGAGFDLTFIDADKPSTADYFTWAVKLARPGGLIVVDNVVRKGQVVDAASADENVQGIRRFMQVLANEPRVSGTAIQTVGGKGYDGFVLAVVNGDRLSM
jgi:predicted O-methyltransferase YrrM